MCDVDSSGSWGDGEVGLLLHQPIRGKTRQEEREGMGRRNKER